MGWPEGKKLCTLKPSPTIWAGAGAKTRSTVLVFMGINIRINDICFNAYSGGKRAARGHGPFSSRQGLEAEFHLAPILGRQAGRGLGQGLADPCHAGQDLEDLVVDHVLEARSRH